MAFGKLFSWVRLLFETAIIIISLVGHSRSQTSDAYFIHQDICPGRVVNEDNCPRSVLSTRRIECARYCGQEDGCVAFLWDPGSRLCRLCNTTSSGDCNDTVAAAGRKVFVLKCLNGGFRISGQCHCAPAFDGVRCQNRMTDCKDWQQAGYTGNVVKWIYPILSPQPFQIMCQLQWGRGLFMNRKTKSQDFYQNWTQYASGFGDVSQDYWLGLNRLHELTHSRCYKLTFQLTLSNNTYYQQYYNPFQVANESQYFTFSFSTTMSWVNPFGDCLSDVKGKPFSTYDADHDDASTNCAERYHSGWWFGNCTLCNPTGIMRQPADMLRVGDTEVFWTPGLGDVVPKKVMILLLRC